MGLLFVVVSCKKNNEENDPTKVTDVDGNAYTTVEIGTQVWMAENLKTTKYRNGDAIGTTTPADKDLSAESTPKYQWAYDGNESNVAVYGRLYTWYAATDSRSICPTGWHLPSKAEWTTLITALGGEHDAYISLKEEGYTHWVEGGWEAATNESGFTARPGGSRSEKFGFGGKGYQGYWCSTTEYNATYAWYSQLVFNIEIVYQDYMALTKKEGLSVRCIKD